MFLRIQTAFRRPSASDFLDFSFETVSVSEGFVAHFGAIVVYCGQGVTQEFCDLVAVGYSEPYQGEDPQLGVGGSGFFGHYSLFRQQQGVEILHKCREQIEERLVKAVVEKFQLVIRH